MADRETIEKNRIKSHRIAAGKVHEADVLIAFEIACKLRVLCHRDDGRFIAEERHQGSGGRYARQVEERSQYGLEHLLQKVNYAKNAEDSTQSSRQHTHCHQVEDSIEQQIVCRPHNRVEHIREAHHRGQIAEKRYNDYQARYAARYLLHFFFRISYRKGGSSGRDKL